MKIITVFGNYRYNSVGEFNGLVALYQIENLDNKDSIQRGVTWLIRESLSSNIVLVPFSHISDDVKPVSEAKELSDFLFEICKGQKKKGEVFNIPFGEEKMFYLNSNGIANFKFRKFDPKQKQRVRRIYDKYVESYDSHMLVTGHYVAQEILVEQLKDYFEDLTIDLGAGTGYLSEYLLKKNIVKFIHVNDFSERMLEVARIRIPKELVLFSSFDAESINLPLKYKTIICCNLFFYLSNPDMAINNWKKLLQKNGRIVVMEEFPFLFPVSNILQKFSKDLKKVHNYMTPDEIVELFSTHSLKLVNRESVEIDDKHSLYGYVFELE